MRTMTPAHLPSVAPTGLLDAMHACVTSRMGEQSLQTIVGASSAQQGTIMALAAAAPGVNPRMARVNSLHEAMPCLGCRMERDDPDAPRRLTRFLHDRRCPVPGARDMLAVPPC